MDEHDLRELAAEVERLRSEAEHDRALLQEMAMAWAAGRQPRQDDHVYADWQSWVDGWLLPRVSRSPHRYRWCHQYAEHAEVAERLESLWHAWESVWPEPAARLGWFRDGLDHQWPIIAAEDGPLRSCSAVEGVHVGDEASLSPDRTGGAD